MVHGEKMRKPPKRVRISEPVTDFGEVTEERLKRGLLAAAYIVTTHGRQYGPIFDRLERELKALLEAKKNDSVERAQRYLLAHTIDGATKKAIR
ncbi:hypothetical protein AJ88_33145 [Mesorhizobium amorphae CCBAU 01583]|nr:hypothetical protein AJ88_33145 [Mesorhizobium amorphae CCBAU 01583]